MVTHLAGLGFVTGAKMAFRVALGFVTGAKMAFRVACMVTHLAYRTDDAIKQM